MTNEHQISQSNMSVTLERLEQAEVSELPVTIRNAGIDGAGGAGFPSYAKWDHLDRVDNLLMNHQESEPNYFIDKWLGREHAEEYAVLFDGLLDRALDTIVISAKEKNREGWMGELEAAMDGVVYTPNELPVDPDEESGVVFAYTDDQYEYGMESVLLRIVGDTVMGSDLPMDHGWIVQNTETLYNIYRTLEDGSAMTRKYLHVDGETPRHRFLEAPIGTPGSALLEAAGLPAEELRDDQVLVDGGPGWCFEIENAPDEFGVRKRTNCVLVLDSDTVAEHTFGDERINVLDTDDWGEGDMETEPTETLTPDYVRIPLITNPAFAGIVAPSNSIVETGDRVEEGEMIATPATEGISSPQHASIDGEVTSVTDTHIRIRHDRDATGAAVRTREMEQMGQLLYWTWCIECGEYVTHPEIAVAGDPTRYVCENCR